MHNAAPQAHRQRSEVTESDDTPSCHIKDACRGDDTESGPAMTS